MSFHQVTVKGTLKPDGSLELDESPNLPPGRVEVMLRPETEPVPKEVLGSFLERLAREGPPGGRPGRTREQIDAEITALRDELEERFENIERIRGHGAE
jgi:hypothetical protein